MTDLFKLGVNYWPRKKAMYWWKQFDAEEVREEFNIIKSIGLGWVRIFLLWEDFQPTPDAVDANALKNLETVADIAREHGLKLDVTFFTGHMSGPNWSPSWLLDANETCKLQVISQNKVVEGGYRNPYTDEVARNAQRLLVKTVVSRLRGHKGVGMWNLGNEPDLFAVPPTREIGVEWLNNMKKTIRGVDPVTPITCGLHADSLIKSEPHRPNDTFTVLDVAVMHSYPMYSDISRSPLDPWYVPFTCALTSALSGGKPTLMEEFGGCTVAPNEPSQVWEWEAYGKPRQQFMASETDMADYLELVLENLVKVGASGAFLWCYADYVEELWDKPPCDEVKHERFFGLVRPDGTLKPHAEVLKRFSQRLPHVQAPTHPLTLDVTPDEYYNAPHATMKRLYNAWIEQFGL